MNKFDAARVLGLDGLLTQELVKTAYRRAAMKFHPDRNPAGLEMMKLINEANEVLSALDFDNDYASTVENDQPDYADDLAAALNAIIHLTSLIIEVCGVWVWVSGNTQEHKAAIKEAGYKWASKKKMWYFKPNGFKSRGRGKATMDDIRATYGSTTPTRPQQTAIHA